MVLSTAENDAVTSRMMSIVRLGDQFYFQTDKNFRKYNQLIANPQAALCVDNTQIEGICKELGHPSQCTAFAKVYEECFPDSYERYTLLQNERVFVLSPKYIQRWVYIDGIPFIERFDVKKRHDDCQQYSGR